MYPTISICFINGRMFPERGTYRRRFRLFDPKGKIQLTDDLDIHLLELPNFQRDLEDLTSPLDFGSIFSSTEQLIELLTIPFSVRKVG